MAYTPGMWAAIEADFHREYGFDMAARGALRSVSWRWFVTRLGNLSGKATVRHVLSDNAKKTPAAEASITDALNRKARRK